MDSFNEQIQCEEVNFYDTLAEVIYSLAENEREEIIAELIKMNHGLKNPN